MPDGCQARDAPSGRGAYSESALAALALEGVEAEPKRPASVAATSRIKLDTSRCSLTSWRPQAALSSRATCSTAKGVKIWVRHIYDTLATERGRPCASVCRVSCRVVCACAYVLLELVGEKRVEEDMLVQHGGGGLGRAGGSRGADHATGVRTGPCAPPHPRCPDRRCAGTPRRT